MPGSDPHFRGLRGALALFCEDIRREASGQLSYVGVYGDVIATETFPVIVPKFSIALFIWTSANEPFREVTIRVWEGEAQLLHEHSLDAESLQAMAVQLNALPLNEDDPTAHAGRRLMVRTYNTISPLVISNETFIRVRIDADGEEIRAGAIRFVTKGQPDLSAGGGSLA
jgi:uncharacterized protein DUF6941